jgi:RNA polymerase sigma-70 factor (ECF subfamily)
VIENQRSVDPDWASIDPLVLTVVRVEAGRLAGRYGFSLSDRDDIRQELLLDCFVRLRRFNSAKASRRTFLYRLVRHRVATLLESQSAACRDYRLCGESLNGPARFDINASILLGDTVSTDDYDARLGRNALSSWERAELRIDVAAAIAILPPEMAAIARLLTSIGVVETAHQLGIPRATLYRRIADIRTAFEHTGLGLYVGRSSSIRTASSASAVRVSRGNDLEGR